MTLTTIFFNIAISISLFFALCFIVLFVAYMMIYHRVNKNFKAVDLSNPFFSRSFLVQT